MKKLCNNILLILALVCSEFCCSQNEVSSNEALEQYHIIGEELNRVISGTSNSMGFKTSLTKEQLEIYLKLSYQKIDLLEHIDGECKLKLNFLFDIGHTFYGLGLMNESIVFFNKYLKQFKICESEIPQNKEKAFIKNSVYIYGTMAMAYNKLKQPDSASIMLQKSIEQSSKYKTVLYPSALNNYGLLLLENKTNLDSALIYFKKAYDICTDEYPNHSLRGSIRDNIADVYLKKNKIKDAKELYKTNFFYYQTNYNTDTKAIDVTRLISAGCQLIVTCIELQQFEKASQYCCLVEKLYKQYNDNVKKLPKTRLEFFETKALVLSSTQKYKEAFSILQQVNTLKDSIREIESANDLLWEESLNNLVLNRVKLDAEIQNIKAKSDIEKQKFRTKTIGLIAIIILLTVIFLLINRRQLLINNRNKQLLAEQKVQAFEEKNKRLHFEVKAKERDLSDFAINLSQNREWASLITDKIEVLKKSRGRQRNKQIKIIENEVVKKLNFEKNVQELYEHFEKLGDFFYYKLNVQFPNLSKNEKRLCCLIRLKMDNHQIATIQNISPASLNTSRYRLRKKMNLPANVDLDTFILNI